MSPLESHYDILEVSPKASPEVIRAAYKSLMQRHHPDKSGNGSAATQQAASIALAYEVLSDPQRRLAYDQTRLTEQPAQRSADHPIRPSQTYHAAPKARPAAVKRLRAWYAPTIILCIIIAGTSILMLAKRTTPDRTTALESAASTPRPLSAPHSEPPLAVTDVGQIRTIAAFVTNLSVELSPDPTQPATVHVLRIPSLSLRLSISEPERWTQRIQAQRVTIIEQLLVTLSAAKYHELIKPDGDLYLKKLIEQSVLLVTGLDQSNALPTAGQANKDPQPVQALLPVSFSVQ